MVANLNKRLVTSLILFLLLFGIFKSNYLLVFTLLIFGPLSLIEFYTLTKKVSFKKNLNILINVSFTMYIFSFCILFFFFSNFIQLKMILFSLLLCCISSDIGGYTIGNLIKGPKLTKISPNKTISGAIGSIIFSLLSFSLAIYLFTANFSYKIILIGIVTSIFCQIGDLFFSFLKRRAKIKDSGNFLPGHGGILDRLDGIFLGIPAGFFTLIYVIK